MRKVLEAVMLRLKEQVPELQYVAIDAGQMSAGGSGMSFPLALVDVASVEYLPAAKGLSRPTVRVEVELFFSIVPQADLRMAADAAEVALGMFDLVSRADEVLQGLEADGFRPLCRLSVGRNKAYAPRSFVLAYTCRADEA